MIFWSMGSVEGGGNFNILDMLESETWSFHSSEDLSWVLLDCDAVA